MKVLKQEIKLMFMKMSTTARKRQTKLIHRKSRVKGKTNFRKKGKYNKNADYLLNVYDVHSFSTIPTILSIPLILTAIR